MPTSVIQSTKAYNGSKARNRHPSVEELNQQNSLSINGSPGVETVIRPPIYEESDVEMEVNENLEKTNYYSSKVVSPGSLNGVQNGSNHYSEWEIEENENMGNCLLSNILLRRA